MESKNIMLDTIERKIGNKSELRVMKNKGLIPACIYGPELKENVNCFINENEVVKILRKEGENHPISLNINGKKIVTIIKDFKYSIIKSKMIHVDFYAVSETKSVKTHIPVVFVGISRGEKEGSLVEKFHQSVEIEAKMKDMPDRFEIDISELIKGDKILAEDIKLPKGVKLITPQEEILVLITGKRDILEQPAPTAMTVEETEKAKEIFD